MSLHVKRWVLSAVLIVASGRERRALPFVLPNANIERAGVLRDTLLTVNLEARRALWRFSTTHAPMSVDAFAEAGKAPVMPGPLLRVPAGTRLRITLRNSLAVPITLLVPAALRGGADRVDAMDTILVAPGAVDSLTTRADAPGSYVYRGTLPDGASKISHIAGILAGAIVVDSVGAARRSDRVLVLMATEDSASAACDDSSSATRELALGQCRGRRFIYTINGTQWPNTERVRAAVGDSLHWRVINASSQVHPMHLHGFYFRVDALTGPFADARPAPGQLVVTQLLDALSSMSMTWSPERPGNWLFHCHFALHNASYSMIAARDDPGMRDMVGLVIGAIVARKPGAVAARRSTPRRHLRLLAEAIGVRKAVGPDTLPAMHFVLDDYGRRVDTHADVSPELDLVRGEAVAITIVNHLDVPTSVHWHGIEVEDSYMDGAPGFSGEGRHLAPAIAPGDSFTARFTPRRSGTFMYHAHMDEMRQELAGLDGMLIVRDSAGPAPNEFALLFKGDAADRVHPLEINGRNDPDTLVLHVGRRVRFRLGDLSRGTGSAAPSFWLTARPDSAATIGRDTLLVRWRPIAKDGFDLPASAQSLRPAQQVVSVGETVDVEFTPAARGSLRLEVRTPRGQHALLVRVPIRVVD